MNKNAIGLLLLRFGLGGVFLLFGIDKFFNPDFWTAFVPAWLSLAVPISIFLNLTGVFEIIAGLLLIFGIFTRIAALFCAIFLVGISVSLGWNETTIRDLGLLFLALGIFVIGGGKLSLGRKQ